MRAQQFDTHIGKTLRLTDEGGVPKDNPFVNTPGVKPEIFTYRHRNGYGSRSTRRRASCGRPRSARSAAMK
jgi:glucose/arabinose dehydrogenase